LTDSLLWITEKNKYLNDSYETYLWAKNTSQKLKTEEALRKLLKNYDDNITYVDSLNQKINNDIKNIDFYKSDSSYIDDLNSALLIISETKKMLSDLNDVLNNSIATSTFTQWTIDLNKSSISQKQSAIILSESTLIWLKNWVSDINNSLSWNNTGIDTNKVSLDNALSIAKIQLENAKQNLATLKSNLKLSSDNISWSVDLTKEQLNNTIATIKNSRDQADNSVKIAEAQLNSSLARLNSQLVQTKSQLDASKWQTDLASIALNNSVIKAPFDSTVVSKMVEVWSLVNPGTPLFSISSSDKSKVKVDMTIDNASNLTLWKEVKLELINWNTSTWTISLLPKNPDSKTNLFQVEIIFDNNKLKSKIWEYVNVYIDKKQWDKKWLMVPFEAILNVSSWVYNVFVVSNSWTISSREVTLWLKNNTSVEILTGLTEKEIIAVSKVWELEDWDLIEIKRESRF
jgi:RND family efflux transporter MFP subunit